MWDEIRNIKSEKKNLREFGLTIGSVLLVLGTIALWRGKGASLYLFVAGVLFIGMGLARPGFLKPLHKIWMGLAIILGFFVSHVILIFLFYAVITPIGLVARLLGNDILDERIQKEKTSYWKDRDLEPKKRESYENQY